MKINLCNKNLITFQTLAVYGFFYLVIYSRSLESLIYITSFLRKIQRNNISNSYHIVYKNNKLKLKKQNSKLLVSHSIYYTN